MYTFKLTVYNEFDEVAETIESNKAMTEKDVQGIVSNTIWDLATNERFELEMRKVAEDVEYIEH